jgi:hypothetical protein
MLTEDELQANRDRIAARQAAVEASRAELLARKPEWAQALIVAELEKDESDSMTDYFATSTARVVALAWSSHKRDIFSEMRKAAAKFESTQHLGPGCDIFTARVVLAADVVSSGAYYKGSPSHWHSELDGGPMQSRTFSTRAAVEAFIAGQPTPESITFNGGTPEEKTVGFEWNIRTEKIEHREKYSMGSGYYLKASGCYSSGWQVHKTDCTGGGHVVELQVLDAPKRPTPQTTPAAADESVEEVAITLNEEKNGIEIRFPAKPAAAVLSGLKANGWRWSRFSSCWYHRDTPAARAYAQGLHAQADPHCTCNDCQADAAGTPEPEPRPSQAERELVAEHAAALKLRLLADGMDAAIDSKMNPGVANQNRTPRRIRIADGMRKDGQRLQHVQIVLRKLADAHEAPEQWSAIEAIWPAARSIRSKAEVERLSFEGRTWIGAKETHSPSVLERLAGGPVEDTPAMKIRRLEDALVGTKIPGFFPTPFALALQVIELANIEPGMRVLEPSAGKGDLADAAKAAGAAVDVIEVSSTLCDILRAKGYELAGRDIFSNRAPVYDRIVMNPPFEAGADMAHVRHCFDELLAPGGRLVAIVGESVFFRDGEKFTEFRAWMAEFLTNDPQPIRDGFVGAQAFRQTGVATRIIVLDKPAAPSALAFRHEMRDGDDCPLLWDAK